MLVVTLGEGETCPVCWENLELQETSRFSLTELESLYLPDAS